MTYKVTQKVLDLVEELFEVGYEGEATFTNSGCSGTMDFLDGAFAIQLSGFCKETLHLVEDTDTGCVVAIGRYDIESENVNDVEGIVAIAWNMYYCYEDSGYAMPSAFLDLFKKYDYIKEKTRTTTYYEKVKQ